jgi:iron complex outermembrane receptor protein
LWSSYSYQPYRFENYQQAGTSYSGNELTGVPRNIWVSGVDVETKNGIYFNASINATSSLPLTDANDAYADAINWCSANWVSEIKKLMCLQALIIC